MKSVIQSLMQMMPQKHLNFVATRFLSSLLVSTAKILYFSPKIAKEELGRDSYVSICFVEATQLASAFLLIVASYEVDCLVAELNSKHNYLHYHYPFQSCG